MVPMFFSSRTKMDKTPGRTIVRTCGNHCGYRVTVFVPQDRFGWVHMTNVNDSRIGLKLRELHERLDELRAAITHDQTGEYVREVVADLRRLAKGCERASTNMIENFSAEIRDLRLANETLKAKGALHEAVFENSNDGIVITTRGGDFLDVNQGFVRLVGCKTKEEVFARKIENFYADPRQRNQMRRKVDRMGVAMDFEIKFRRIDGSEIDTLHTIDVRLDGEGRISGYQESCETLPKEKWPKKPFRKLATSFRHGLTNARPNWRKQMLASSRKLPRGLVLKRR